MKETIEYYYKLTIDKLFVEKDNYHFILYNHDFYFTFFKRTEKELEDIVKIINELNNKGIYTHKLVLNINGSFLTNVDNTKYVLIEVTNKDEIISISDMLKYNRLLSLYEGQKDLYRNNWQYLWSSKIDYFENQLNEENIPKIISNTINYYIGLTENAIYYVNNVNRKYVISSLDKIVLSRKRIIYPNYNLNYFNPLTFIFDLEVRDIAEYIKSSYFNNDDAFLELDTYLKSVKLSPYMYNMLFARLLYPSYYFDIYDEVINNGENEEKLLKIISMASSYEQFLKKAYKQISLYAMLEDINWLKN